MRKLTVLIDWFGEAAAGALVAAYVAAVVAGMVVVPLLALLQRR